MKQVLLSCLAALLCMALIACTAAPSAQNSSSSAGENVSTDGSSHTSAGEPSAPSESAAAKEIQGSSLEEAGLAITGNKAFPDPNMDQESITWNVKHMTAESQEWNSIKRVDYGGDITFVTVETTERKIDTVSHLMFLLQCYRPEDLADGNTVKIQGEQVPAKEVLEKKICETGGWIVCDLTSYALPEGFRAAMEQWEKDNAGDYDFQWTFDVYDYFSQNLPDLIAEGTASEALPT